MPDRLLQDPKLRMDAKTERVSKFVRLTHHAQVADFLDRPRAEPSESNRSADCVDIMVAGRIQLEVSCHMPLVYLFRSGDELGQFARPISYYRAPVRGKVFSKPLVNPVQAGRRAKLRKSENGKVRIGRKDRRCTGVPGFEGKPVFKTRLEHQ